MGNQVSRLAEFSVNIIASLVTGLDRMLGFWVVDGNLTDPRGYQLVGSLVTIIENFVLGLAQIASITT